MRHREMEHYSKEKEVFGGYEDGILSPPFSMRLLPYCFSILKKSLSLPAFDVTFAPLAYPHIASQLTNYSSQSWRRTFGARLSLLPTRRCPLRRERAGTRATFRRRRTTFVVKSKSPSCLLKHTSPDHIAEDQVARSHMGAMTMMAITTETAARVALDLRHGTQRH